MEALITFGMLILTCCCYQDSNVHLLEGFQAYSGMIAFAIRKLLSGADVTFTISCSLISSMIQVLVLLLVNAQRCSPITIDFANQDGQLLEVEINCFSRVVTFACVDRIASDEGWRVVLWRRQRPCTSERPG